MKKFKKFSIIVLVLIMGGVGAYYVVAELATDSYVDDSKIASNWNTSTSTFGEIKLESRSCDFFNWYCLASTTCANDLGDGDYIIVAREDSSTTLSWKTSATSCDKPQCGIDGGQVDELDASNSLDYTEYPARDYCKSVGGRLPTYTETACMYNNQASFGYSFADSVYYQTSTEYDVDENYIRRITTNTGSTPIKNVAYYVRCVKGW